MSLVREKEVSHLQRKFRRSMRRLLSDLCDDLEEHYADAVKRWRLPVPFFRFLQASLPVRFYSNWKIAGWIESLNDLVYFVDLLAQLKREADRTDFTEQLLRECQGQFFEHGYLDDLFPCGLPKPAGLETRLTALCRRLAQEAAQEAFVIRPYFAPAWCASNGPARWDLEGDLSGSFERAEPRGVIPVGTDGEWYEPPPDLKQKLRRSSQCILSATKTGISLLVNGKRCPILALIQDRPVSRWSHRTPAIIASSPVGTVTVGPTLVYDRHRQPCAVRPTSSEVARRIKRAWETVKEAWPEGHGVLALLTSRLIPLRAKGVVSFSYRHRPGLSFINCFDRDNLDLIDDLIHENSHHHLNLLLRKSVMYRGDHNQQIFYSPWRRSLRPLRGILHATFTFTMGAMLFERLSAWGSGREGMARWKRAGLTPRDLQRARFRCLEEIASVRHSLEDLRYADENKGWLTSSGRTLVEQLTEAISTVERRMARYRKKVARSPFGPALRRHEKELRKARQTYGPMSYEKRMRRKKS